MATRTEMLGSMVTPGEPGSNVAYTLTGPRGGIRRLIRNQHNQRLLYVIDKFGQICSVKGNYTFADDAPKGLRAVYAANLYR